MLPSFSPQTDEERFDWLRLFRTGGIGPLRFWKLLSIHHSAAQALSFLEAEVKKGKEFILPKKEEIEAERELVEKKKARLVFKGDPLYPQEFLSLEDAPPVLTHQGVSFPSARPRIGIVGARNASASGCYFAQRVAHDLGREGVIVVSGLARGIDTAAHKGALSTGTIALMAGGIDIIYPMENKRLYEEIRERGSLFSEIKIGTHPQSSHFPRRNRLISGMSEGVALIEASLNSGSMITAEIALTQGREIFATPGFPLDPRSEGCHALIKEGATLLTKAQDILDFLAQKPYPFPFFQERRQPRDHEKEREALKEPKEETSFSPLSLETYILESVSSTPISIDMLVRNSSKPTAQILGIISALEISGKVRRLPGNRLTREWSS